MTPRAYQQVDVFTRIPYLGNALGVVMDGSGLSDEEMQAFARWTNLSETTFLLPPSPAAAAQGADYRVRIFTPGSELPFAGHPTLGSCHAWLQAGGAPKAADTIVQECAKGLVQAQARRHTPGVCRAQLAAQHARCGTDRPCGSWLGAAHRANPRSAMAGQRAGVAGPAAGLTRRPCWTLQPGPLRP